jgi:hypothetical protein
MGKLLKTTGRILAEHKFRYIASIALAHNLLHLPSVIPFEVKPTSHDANVSPATASSSSDSIHGFHGYVLTFTRC